MTTRATVDDQDRLRRLGSASYTYADDGHLAEKVDAETGARTAYRYDALGNLLRVDLPGGRRVEYVVDGANRRVARKVDGEVERGWLYDGARIVAELDGSGVVRSRFVYATRGHVPDYMVRDGQTFRLLSDHLGSPRLVVDAASGEVAQRLVYDTFGRITEDTAPGFQPFGFAGGLLDSDTGLTRFGARDYDATAARWTAKDPIGFAGGDTNLYGYVLADPVNLIDPSGLCGIDLAADVAFTGYSIYKAIRGCGNVAEIGLNAAGALIPCAGGVGTARRAVDDAAKGADEAGETPGLLSRIGSRLSDERGEFDPFAPLKKRPETTARRGDPQEAMDDARRLVDKERIARGADPNAPIGGSRRTRLAALLARLFYNTGP